MTDPDDPTLQTKSPHAEEMPHRIGHYRVLGLIGDGAFGTVYEAEQTEPVRRRVAIKVVKAGMDSKQVLARFEAERQALAVMEHPGIAKFLDAGLTDQSRPYVVMEYVPGAPITDFCEQERLSLDDRVRLMIQVCHAVQHAHMKGVIHRDLKPRNVLVALVDQKPVAKVIDFGVAKALTQPLTGSTIYTERGQLLGTPEYMSPEQARGSGVDIDTRSDVYSLGAILYELLTGATPFESSTLREKGYAELQRIIEHEEAPKPSTRLTTSIKSSDSQHRAIDPTTMSKRLKGDLDWIVMQCLAKERDRRYATANGLAMDLERYLNNEPVLASPPSATYRLKKFVRRNRATVIAGIVAMIVLVGGLAALSVGFVLVTREAERARVAERRATALTELVHGGTASLAVLPLVNASGDPDQEFLADGVTESLISNLSRISALHVVSDSSVRRYKGSNMSLCDIAEELQVDGLLRGSFQRIGNRIEIAISLTHPLSDQRLWSETFAGELANILTLQVDVARAVANALHLELTDEEQDRLALTQKVNPVAHWAYLRGRAFLQRRNAQGARAALQFFAESLAADPKYALAYAGRADAYSLLEERYEPPLTTMPQAKEAALRAIELDPQLPEAYIALGHVKFNYDWDWEGARQDFEQAMRLNPDLAVAHIYLANYLSAKARHDEAMTRIATAVKLDRATLVSEDAYFSIPINARLYDQSLEYAQQALTLDRNFHEIHTWSGLAYADLGKFDQAIKSLEHAKTLDDSPVIAEFLGGVYARAGRRDDALAMLKELEEQAKTRFVCPYEVATIHVALEDFDKAFVWFNLAIEKRSACIPWLVVDPRLDPIRGDSRYHDLLAETGHIECSIHSHPLHGHSDTGSAGG